MHIQKMTYVLCLLLLYMALAGCGDDPNTEYAAVPTTAPVFGEQQILPIGTIAKRPSTGNGLTTMPTEPITGTTVAAETTQRDQLNEIMIYDGQLAAGWSLDHSRYTEFDPASSRHTLEPLGVASATGITGQTSSYQTLAVSPQWDYATLYFTLSPDATVSYSREEVVGVSLWVNSGDDLLETDDLLITIVGSNEYPYWVEDDRSALEGEDDSFSGTRLHFLGIRETVPANTWIRIEVLLDDLRFDPYYDYLTGIKVRNDEGYRSTFYVDRVALLVLPDEGIE